jgi:thiamine-monophosphate kinase
VALSEFDLIRRFFADATAARDDVVLGVGDDCALLRPSDGELLAVSMDTLVAGRHFLPDADPVALGHKALAVNLSDLAAMGARPAWVTLALTLPRPDSDWLAGFVAGFAALAADHDVQLVGGDTTRGPLSITLQAHGFVRADAALRRAGARPGDRLCVSGTPGDAGLALALLADGVEPPAALLARLHLPTPRVALGRLLAGRASAAIDVSDGLLGDLGHVCRASAVGARLELDALPLSPAARSLVGEVGWGPVLSGGDDYELLFCIAESDYPDLAAACKAAGERVTAIGRIVHDSGIVLASPDGSERDVQASGFDHFAEPAP